MKLVIISHTEHYLKNNKISGWGPTINEINHLLDVFDKIYHVAVLIKDQDPPASAMPYKSEKIEFIPIGPSGGTTLLKKIKIIGTMPKTIKIVRDVLKKADYFQLRSPTGIGVYLIPYLSFFTKKPGWFKYAGNWKQVRPPLGYRFQRFFLKNLQNNKVTVNGFWPKDPRHINSFENPCLDENDRDRGYSIMAKKEYDSPMTFCFAGNFGKGKGEDIFLDAIKNQLNKKNIDQIHFLGDGDNINDLKKVANSMDVKIFFHGFVGRSYLFNIFSQSHFIVLPSKSEGFPKVIAEASNFGCIPIVSNVGSISHYIKNQENGFLWDNKKMSFLSFFNDTLKSFNKKDLKKMAMESYALASKFTYNRYNYSIKNRILN